jgi:exosortase H (IPTLxxWG-CTERM-specific)
MKNKKSAQRQAIKKFGVIFVLLCSVFYVISNLTPGSFAPLNNYNAAVMGFLLQALGLQPMVQDDLVVAGGFGIKVIAECSAIFVFILFVSFVLAYPTSVKKKAIGLLFGIPTLFAVNTLRLMVVFLAGLWYPDLFEYVHVYFWQTITIILVFIACLAWLHLVVMVETRNKPIAFLVRFIAFSSILFLIWLHLDTEYCWVIVQITEFLLNCMGYSIHVGIANVTVHSGTFNLVAFTALVLATQSIGRSKKIKAVLIGLPILMIMHVVYSVYGTLAYFQAEPALKIMLTAQFIGQYVLPFGLWLAFTYKDVFKRAGTYICPICGAEKVGIVEHIRVKHGEKALEDAKVKAMLEARTQRGVFKVSKVVEKLRLPDVGIVDYIKKKFRVLLRKKK